MTKLGKKAENFTIKMINGIDFDLFTSLSHGPVVLNFIMGTWCPTCTLHIQRIRRWQNTYEKRKATILTISSEPHDTLKAYIQKKQMTLLFASDPEQKVINSFGLKMPFINISRPATVLIDHDKIIKMIYKGMRTNGLLRKINSECDACLVHDVSD